MLSVEVEFDFERSASLVGSFRGYRRRRGRVEQIPTRHQEKSLPGDRSRTFP